MNLLLILLPILIYLISIIGAHQHNARLYSRGGLKYKFKKTLLDKVSIYLPIINTLIWSDLLLGKTTYMKKIYMVFLISILSLSGISQPIPGVNNNGHSNNGHHHHHEDGAPLNGGLSILIGLSAIYGYKVTRKNNKEITK